MKICPRAKLTREDQIRHSNSERAVLKAIDHPFIVKLYVVEHNQMCWDKISDSGNANRHRTFKDEKCIYFLFEFVPGGELFSILRTYRVLSEKAVRFYSAQIVLALEYLHSKKIVYRDLKPGMD
jgi:protein kinase A